MAITMDRTIYSHDLRRNFKALWAVSFFRCLMFLMPLFIPWCTSLGLSFAEIMITQSVFAAAMFVFEVPSGYLADRWGRKPVIVAGVAFGAVGFTGFLFADSFWDICFIEVLLAIGFSLTSGADLALLYDSHHELEAIDDSYKVNSDVVVSRYSMASTFGEGVGAGLASVLFWYSMDWVIWAQVITGWVALGCALLLVEPQLHQESDQHTQAVPSPLSLRYTLHQLFGRCGYLRVSIALFVLLSSGTYLMVWMLQGHWQAMEVPLEWFGGLWMLKGLAITGVAWLVSHWVERWGHRSAPIVGAGLALMAFGFMATESMALIIFTIVCLAGSRAMTMVTMRDLMNQEFERSFRATANSVVSLVFRSTAMVILPVMGWMMDVSGMAATIAGLAFGYGVLALVLIMIWLKLDNRRWEASVVQ